MNSQRTRSSNDIHILIAEDSPTQAQQLQHLLEETGYKVAMATNGKEALAVMRNREPSLVISDIMMPEMDGFALCKEIKSNKKLKEVPVVLLTSLSSPSDVVQGLQCGADNFIRKPYEGKYLLNRVHQLLTNRELQKSEKIRVGLKVRFQGQEYLITSERQQVLDLLMSTFEEAIHLNDELRAREQELKAANERLETEVAERKRAEAETRKLNNELGAANKELEAFSYSVSHDLRAPLRSIDGFSQVLVEDHPLDEHGRDCLERIQTAAKHMGELIDGLLNLSRVSRGEMLMGTADLSAIAHGIAKELQQAEPDRSVEFVIAPGLVANGDARLLRSVLDNLLRNAWKFTKERPIARIEFGISRDADKHKPTYFVRDNGAGFEMEYADKLFQPFQRLHSSAEFQGTGIGLATVQRVVHKHGGEVWAEAEKDKGAAFYFTLPS